MALNRNKPAKILIYIRINRLFEKSKVVVLNEKSSVVIIFRVKRTKSDEKWVT